MYGIFGLWPLPHAGALIHGLASGAWPYSLASSSRWSMFSNCRLLLQARVVNSFLGFQQKSHFWVSGFLISAYRDPKMHNSSQILQCEVLIELLLFLFQCCLKSIHQAMTTNQSNLRPMRGNKCSVIMVFFVDQIFIS